MIDVASLFEKPREKLGWAREATNEFDNAARKFLNVCPHEFLTETDPSTGEDVYKFVLRGKLPSAVFRKANEAIEGVKNSFDQAMFASIVALGGKMAARKSVYFPWADTIAGLEHRLGSRKSMIPNRLHNTLVGLKPYGTGQDCTTSDHISRKLAQIANRKHTVGLSMDCHVVNARLPGFQGMIPAGSGPYRFRVPKWDPVKNEVELFRGPKGSGLKLVHQTQIQVYLVLDEPFPLKGISFVEVMGVFSAKAQTVIETLEAGVTRLRKS